MIAVQIPECSKNICWKGQSYTNGGKIWQQEFDAIVGGYFLVFKF
jgi:hypothetical protein